MRTDAFGQTRPAPINTGLFAPETAESAFRATDPATSMNAAKHAGQRITRTRRACLNAHADRPSGLTDFELAELTGLQQTSAGKRRLDLERDGLIERTDLTRCAPSGSAAVVWRITAAGLALAEELAR